MKHPSPDRQRRRSGPVFPGRNAWASLKQGGAEGAVVQRVGLPRQKCLGLIEARLALAPFRGRFCVFPGRNAWASLKLPNLPDQRPLGRVVFPGRNAWASLKLHPDATRKLLSHCLPRQKCLGLIEARRGAESGRAVQHPGLPRQKCLGLIEAARIATWVATNSGLPRQKCLGLIEAICLVAPNNASGTSSQAEMPGPH